MKAACEYSTTGERGGGMGARMRGRCVAGNGSHSLS
jgi:hypothetical protein